MIAHFDQPVGKAGDDKIDPIFEVMLIKKETDEIKKKLDEIDKCVGRLGLYITRDDEKNS